MSPIDDLTYDVITVLQAKAKALAAYDKYVSDAEADDDEELRDMFTSMRRQDEEQVQQLKEVLAQRLAEDLGYADDEDEDDDDDDDDDEDEDEDYDDEVDGAQVEAPSGADAGGSSNRQR